MPDTNQAKGGVGVVALVFILVFLVFWAFVLVKVYTYDVPKSGAGLKLPWPQPEVLSLLTTALATGTAAVLGIEIKAGLDNQAQLNAAGGKGAHLRAAIKDVFSTASVLWVGIISYLLVAILVLCAWFFRGTATPELVHTVGASVLGWAAGAIAAVFKASSA